MIDVERDLALLGDRLALDDEGLVDDVLAAIDSPASGRSSSDQLVMARRWLVAAAVLMAVIASALVVPSSRRAIADWFGLDGVGIEQQPDLSVPAAVADDLPDGIVVGRFDGALDDELITKLLGADTSIQRVDVGGRPGLWIDGAPHELVIRGADGEPTTRRFAGNTLLWQDGDTIHRVEGAATLAEALAVAEGV